MKENVEFKKLREFGDIIGDTFLFVKQNFKPLMKAFFVLCGMFMLGGIVASVLTQLQVRDITSNFYDGSYQEQSSKWTMSFGLRYVTVIGFMVLNFTAYYVTVLSFITLYNVKGRIAPNVEEVWSYFRYYFFRVLISNIGIFIFVMLCFFCCVLPGIYVFPAMTLFFPIMIVENAAFGVAFDRSFKLIKDRWWITAATLFVVYIITYVFTTIIQLPGIILMMTSLLTHTEKPVNDIYLYVTTIGQHIAQIFYIIPAIASAFIYYDLVERKESAGLLERMANFGQHQPENISSEEY